QQQQARSKARTIRESRKVVKGSPNRERSQGKVAIELPISVRALSEALGIKPGELLFKLMNQGVTPMPNINSTLDRPVAERIALDHGVKLEIKRASEAEGPLLRDQDLARNEPAVPPGEAAGAQRSCRRAAELLERFKAGRALTGPRRLRELRRLALDLH